MSETITLKEVLALPYDRKSPETRNAPVVWLDLPKEVRDLWFDDIFAVRDIVRAPSPETLEAVGKAIEEERRRRDELEAQRKEECRLKDERLAQEAREQLEKEQDAVYGAHVVDYLRQLGPPNFYRRPANRQPQYQREYRQRQNRGEKVLRIRIGPRVIEALLVRGMSDEDSRNPKKLAAELGEVLGIWAAEWLK